MSMFLTLLRAGATDLLSTQSFTNTGQLCEIEIWHFSSHSGQKPSFLFAIFFTLCSHHRLSLYKTCKLSIHEHNAMFACYYWPILHLCTNNVLSWFDQATSSCFFRPDLIDFESLKKSNALYNLQNAFNVAEQHLGLTKLLDPEGLDLWCYLKSIRFMRCVFRYCRRKTWRKIDNYLCRHLLSLLFQNEGDCCGREKNRKGELIIKFASNGWIIKLQWTTVF